VWFRGVRLTLYFLAPFLLTCALFVAGGTASVTETSTSPYVEASLTADYLDFEQLYLPLLQDDALNQAYTELTQPASTARLAQLHARPTPRAAAALTQVHQAIATAGGLGASPRLAPARQLFVQAFTDVLAAWLTEQQAEDEWRAGRFPADSTALRQGSASHPLLWFRDHSHTSLGDGVTLVWHAHNIVLVLASEFRIPPPATNIPMPPKPAFRGV